MRHSSLIVCVLSHCYETSTVLVDAPQISSKARQAMGLGGGGHCVLRASGSDAFDRCARLRRRFRCVPNDLQNETVEIGRAHV